MPKDELRPAMYIRQRLKSPIAILLTLLILAGGLSLVPSSSAEAVDWKGISKAGAVKWTTKTSWGTAYLRNGTTEWGYVHIKRGGTHRKTSNHEVSAAAKRQWVRALNSKNTSLAYNGLKVYAAHYKVGKSKKQARTMCVIYDRSSGLVGKNKSGTLGIVTAYWTTGTRKASSCGLD